MFCLKAPGPNIFSTTAQGTPAAEQDSIASRVRTCITSDANINTTRLTTRPNKTNTRSRTTRTRQVYQCCKDQKPTRVLTRPGQRPAYCGPVVFSYRMDGWSVLTLKDGPRVPLEREQSWREWTQLKRQYQSKCTESLKTKSTQIK